MNKSQEEAMILLCAKYSTILNGYVKFKNDLAFACSKNLLFLKNKTREEVMAYIRENDMYFEEI
jgi:hypothetical protein